MEIRKFLHILNPNSSHRPAVKKFFTQNGQLDYVWVERTSHPTHLETIVEWGLKQGTRNFALWGGDGSFNRLVQALTDQGQLGNCTVALVPTGTGNDFARKIGLSSWKKNDPAVFSRDSVCEKFDLGQLSGGRRERIFVNNAGFGRTPQAANSPRPNPLEDIRSFKEKRIEIECDDGSAKHYETMRVLLMIVFNSPYFNKGLYFDKKISPADGTLNAVMVRPESERKLLWRFLKGRLGFSLESPQDRWMQGTRIAVDSDQLLYPQVDGDPAWQGGSQVLEFSILPQVLNLLVPKRTL
jgi:diacylglycerol kinase family enzyme